MQRYRRGCQPALHLLNVVRRGYQSVFNNTGDDARSATRREADMIVPAVEMPCKADNLALAGERARHAQRQMRRLRPSYREANSFGGRNQLLDKFAPADFQRVTRAVVCAVREVVRSPHGRLRDGCGPESARRVRRDSPRIHFHRHPTCASPQHALRRLDVAPYSVRRV